MLSKSRCPHTGVVNYFTAVDPLLAVGSVAKADARNGYAWRCYVGEEVRRVCSGPGACRGASRAGHRARHTAVPKPARLSAWSSHLREPADTGSG